MGNVLGALYRGYNPVTQAVSELGAVGAPNAIVENANLVISGFLTIAFALGLQRSVDNGKGSKAGPILIVAFGAIFVLIGGVFSLPSPLHIPLSLIGIIAVIAAPFVISGRLKRDLRWGGYRSYSLVSGLVALLIFLFSIFLAGFDAPVAAEWMGLLERLFFLPPLLWMVIMAIRLFRLSSQSKA